MKKFRIITMVFVLLFSFMSVSYAELSSNRIALGIQLGAKFEDAKKVFGVPDRVTMEEIKSEAYGDFVESKFIYGNQSLVVSFYNEGWRTPDGVTVGMPLNDVYARLGKEDVKSPAENGETLYWYNHDTREKINVGNLYVFVKNGRVSRIVIAYQ